MTVLYPPRLQARCNPAASCSDYDGALIVALPPLLWYLSLPRPDVYQRLQAATLVTGLAPPGAPATDEPATFTTAYDQWNQVQPMDELPEGIKDDGVENVGTVAEGRRQLESAPERVHKRLDGR